MTVDRVLNPGSFLNSCDLPIKLDYCFIQKFTLLGKVKYPMELWESIKGVFDWW